MNELRHPPSQALAAKRFWKCWGCGVAFEVTAPEWEKVTHCPVCVALAEAAATKAVEQAEQLGRAAFARDASRDPGLDRYLCALLDQAPFLQWEPLSVAWLKGWDAAFAEDTTP